MNKPDARTGIGIDDMDAEDSAVPSVGDAVLVVSRDGTICNLLRNPQGVLADAASELPGSPIEDLWPEELAQLARDSIKRTLKSREVHSEEFIDEAADRHYEFIFVAQGRDRVLIVVRDISRQQAAIDKMRQMAYEDDATGLPNREYLLEELDKVTDRLRLQGGRAVVICFDIDQIDLAGFSTGRKTHNVILKELATRLTGGLRGPNIPNADDCERYSIVSRVDHRQFAVVLPTIETGADASAVTERLADSMEQPISIESRDIKVIVNAGLALFPQDGTDAATLFDNAIAAMEDTKNSQSVNMKFHSGSVKVRALKRFDLELELKTALERGEFHLNYLPIVKADTRQVETAEALLRWPQGVFGSKPIQQIVALAENTGLIVPIGEWVLRESFAQLKSWHESGHADLRIAINLSTQEFSRGDLTKRVANFLKEFSLDPRFIDFDITEHMLFRDAMKDFATCVELKELGVSIVVDDYGTGACSLAHLSRSPVDTVKIDFSLVENATTNSNDKAACAAATSLAHELGLSVVAEGIETEEQADLLQNIGCDYLQGFLFCEPSPASEFDDYLDAKGIGIAK